jgi:hypothetical protein
VNILKLAAMLTLDGTRFKAGMREAESAATGFGKRLGGAITGQLAAAFGAGALVAFAKDALTSTANLKDMAEQIHVSTDEIQRLIVAGKDFGIEFSDIAAAERQFNQNRKEAVEKSQALRDSFGRLGISVADLQNGSFGLMDAMTQAGAAMEGMSSDEKRRALNDLADIFGTKVGSKLQEFLKGLKEAEGIPLVSKETIQQLDDAVDRMSKILFVSKGILASGIVGFLKGGDVNAFNAMIAPFFTKSTPENKAPGPDLFNDTLEKKNQAKLDEGKEKAINEAAKERLELEKAIFKVQLQQMTSADARAAKEQQLADKLKFIKDAEEDGADATKERTEAVNMLGEMLNGRDKSALSVSQLQQQGQLGGGRNIVANPAESAFVAEAKKILGVETRTAVAIEALNAKIRGVTTLRGAN